MSKPSGSVSAGPSLPARRTRSTRPLTASLPHHLTRRPSTSGLTTLSSIIPVPGAPKAHRASKTTQKLVLLPSAPQTKPLLIDEDDEQHGYETDRGVRDYKSEGERMSKDQRKKAGYKRITAYCVAEGFNMKLLANFLKREHNVQPRMFDEAMYAMYHLPLLPGYGPNSNIRSAPAPTSEDHNSGMSEAEENGYQGTYFTSSPSADPAPMDGYIPSSSPLADRPIVREPSAHPPTHPHRTNTKRVPGTKEEFAEAIFFSYGVVVFFGLDEGQERGILEDVQAAGTMIRKMDEDGWEVEECHYALDPYIAYPRIYNDFFTFKSHSHLLKLSVAHAFAQSTLLAHYETQAHHILSAPSTTSIPMQLAVTGSLSLSRTNALRLTGRLFKLRRDVNLVSNVLDVPELFWSEASLQELYDAVREYMEIGGRVQVLNEKLAVAEDLLGAIHDHLNNNAMERITWIIIWLIVVACLVELGEVLARLVVHATMGSATKRSAAVAASACANLSALSREEVLQTLERMSR